MVIVYTGPDFPDIPDTDSLNLKAESLLNRTRKKREEEVRAAQRKADAALVRAAGCQKLRRCGHEPVQELVESASGSGMVPRTLRMREVHDPACPIALADLLEGKP